MIADHTLSVRGLVLVLTGLLGYPAFCRADDADPKRPPAIQTEGVPKVSEEVWQELSHYEHIRSAGFYGWSPQGQGILIGTRFGNSVQLHRVYEPEGRREQVTFFDEPASGTFIPKAKDASMLATISQGGNENYQIYLIDQAAYRTTLLTDGTSRNSLGPLTYDGQRMALTSNRRNGRDMDVYAADPRKASSLELLYLVDNETWRPTDWSPNGDRLAMIQYVSINESYPAVLDITTKQLTKLPLLNATQASYGTVQFSADGKAVYVTVDAQGEFLQLAKLDLETGEYDVLSDDIPWDVVDVQVDHNLGNVAFVTNEDGASKLYLLEGDSRRRLDLPLGIVSGLQFSPEGEQLGFTLARPSAPAEAYSIHISGDQLTRWTFSEIGGLNPAKFVEPKLIRFTSFDDREISAYYYPAKHGSAERPAAVVIDIHGGPESQYRPYFSSATQHMVGALGVAVIAPNVRGSAGYGKTFLKLDNAELREDSVKDIGALLDWIDKQPELDSSRVAVSGGSYGGYMVLASLVHYPERIRAGTDTVGIANFITFLENTADYRRDLRRAEYGDERDPKMRAIFERINPTANADKIRSALLVAHGRNDPRVPFTEAEQIAERVRKQRGTVWTVYADNEGHGFNKKVNRDYLRGVITEFLIEELELRPEQ